MRHALLFSLALALAATFVAHPLTAQTPPRLVGWWQFEDATNASLLADSSGFGRNAAKGTGVSIVDAGRFGKAARYDGTANAWASFSNPAFTNLTIAAWVYADGISTNSLPRIMQIGSDVYYHMPSNALGQFNFGARGNTWLTSVQDPFKFVTNRWFHAALVYQQQYTSETARVVWATFYINGVRCGDPGARLAFSSAIPAGTAFIGNNSSGPGGVRPLTGLIDDVRLYDAPLSDKEVLALCQNRPHAVDAGADLACYGSTARLQGRLASTNPFMRDLSTALAWSVVSAPPGASPALALPHLPSTTVTLPEPGTYVFRLTASNALGVAADDVTVVRAADAPPPGNAAPSVTPLWSATNTVLGASAALAATVSDDGAPGPVRVRWSKVSGPGAVFFDDAFSNRTSAAFSSAGTYALRLEADDGALQSSADVTVTVSAPAGDVSAGLAHWWRMDDNPALKKATDSASGNTLSLTNLAILQPGKAGYGFRGAKLDSVGVAASLPTNAETMTFSAWLYYDDAYVKGASGNVYQRLYNCGPNFYILFNRVNNQIDLSTRSVDGGITQFTWTWTDPKIPSNQWTHIAVLFDRRSAAANSKQVMYVNGRRYLSAALTSAFSGAAVFTSPFLVGNTSSTGGTRNFDGVLDELRVYSRLITDEEALLLAADPDNNHAPVVDAPAALTARVGRPVSLGAAVTDDGQPLGQPLVTAWSVTSGDPSRVAFSTPSSPSTDATFTHTGEYVIMLSATDGEAPAAALTRVTVVPTGTVLGIQ